MKKILTASLVAMMAVTAANANIASTKYVDDRTGTATFTADSIKDSANLTAAVETLAGTVATNAGAASDAAAQALADAKAYTDDLAQGAVADNAAAIADMDLASVGADGSYIKTVSQADGKVTAVAEAADAAPTPDSTKMVTSGGVYTAIEAAKTAASGANSALADRVGANEQAISTLNTEQDTQGGKISALETSLASGATKQAIDAAKKAGDDAQATIDAYKTANDQALASGLALKEDVANKATTEYTEGSTTQYPSIKIAEDIANSAVASTKTDLSTLQSAVATLNGNAETKGSVAKAVADAKSELQTELDTEVGKLEQADTANLATLRGEIATAKSGAETTAKNYTDTEIAKIDTAYKAADQTLTDRLDTLTGTGDGSIAKQIETVTTKVNTVETEYKAADTGLQSQIDANKTAIESNDVDIKALQDKDATLTALATFPVACATGDSDCALVIRGGTMKWEKVEY